MAKLKPCPFCGEANDIEIYGIYNRKYEEIGTHITCLGCLAHFEFEGAACREDVIAAWNRRAEK